MATITSHLENYLQLLEQHAPGTAPSVRSTVDIVVPKHIRHFDCRDHITGLLLGNVQSGKTSQMFGIISAAADEGFGIFILLTTDNIALQEQTYKRALQLLGNFNVCGETDEVRFSEIVNRQPTLLVLKKNTNVLKTWKNNIASSQCCRGKPLFIIDDEGDAASLNTKINQAEISTINQHLDDIKHLANSSIFLQVTATPQSILLQTKESGWKPSFVHYFPPGRDYLGGDFFYSEPRSYVIRLTDEDELDGLRKEDEYIAEGLRDSLLFFLVASAHITIEGGKVCNFLIHPSVKIKDHEAVANKIGECLNSMIFGKADAEIIPLLQKAWDDLQITKPNIKNFELIKQAVTEILDEQRISIYVMNSNSNQDIDIGDGLNIIVGGNSLGRGVTFPMLQTVYYCRKSKAPQADTFWQHCRMFGYDRDPSLMRIFIPPLLLKLFTDLSKANTALIKRIEKYGIEDISLLYPSGIKPTRANVLERKNLNLVVGGANYFPDFPEAKNTKALDELLLSYTEKDYSFVSVPTLINIIDHLYIKNKNDWNKETYVSCLESLNSELPTRKGILIVRKDRDIGMGTGTLLSPDDRKLSMQFSEGAVLTLYRLVGGKEKGWDGEPLWVPNIKFPDDTVFYRVENSEGE